MTLNNFLRPEPSNDLREMSIQALAHVGDAVYELMVRTYLCSNGAIAARQLHKKSVSMVSAKAQAAAASMILPFLNEDELAVFKRGRNAHQASVPKTSTHEEYHAATALESLFGFLYLCGEQGRLSEIFRIIVSGD
ncbi:MAG: ribonuclease III [Oscillospiraceae bacterium]|nr:ribonuclease III [Oscillospiraceae bacterium]MCL2278079.1 ribonuclease III [Oscillospiraceae bacterium]